MRQVVLDTETTGLEPEQGHRIIEIGCVELENRRLTGNHFHYYLNPERDIDAGAVEVHGLTREFLSDKPLFRQIATQFLEFVQGAELVIHNAPFDLGFLNHELRLMGSDISDLSAICSVLDSLMLARSKHPGSRNNLDALCKRYGIDNSQRQLHGALLDAEILADVYLIMTSGQSTLSLREEDGEDRSRNKLRRKNRDERPPMIVQRASEDELQQHYAQVRELCKDDSSRAVWKVLEPEAVET